MKTGSGLSLDIRFYSGENLIFVLTTWDWFATVAFGMTRLTHRHHHHHGAIVSAGACNS